MYKFRREDTGEVVEVDFATMMAQSAGWITLPDGVQARRVYDGPHIERKYTPTEAGPEKRTVSDALGFPDYQIADFEEHRKREGHAVEFRRDPSFDGFMQVVGSARDMERYAESRKMENVGGHGSGAALSPALMQRTADRFLEKFSE